MNLFTLNGCTAALDAFRDWNRRPRRPRGCPDCPVLYNGVSLDVVLEMLRKDGAEFAHLTRELKEETSRAPEFFPSVLSVQFMAGAGDADVGTWAVSLDFCRAGSGVVGWQRSFTMEKAALRSGSAPGTLTFEWSNMGEESVERWDEHSTEVWTQ